MVTTKIRIDFASKTQGPALMITKETYRNNRIEWAEVLYQEEDFKSEVLIDPRAEALLERRLELTS